MRLRSILVPIMSACLVLAACGTSETESTETAAAALLASEPEGRQVILDLALATYGGGEFDPELVKGKPVILWFWGAF